MKIRVRLPNFKTNSNERNSRPRFWKLNLMLFNTIPLTCRSNTIL